MKKIKAIFMFYENERVFANMMAVLIFCMLAGMLLLMETLLPLQEPANTREYLNQQLHLIGLLSIGAMLLVGIFRPIAILLERRREVRGRSILKNRPKLIVRLMGTRKYSPWEKKTPEEREAISNYLRAEARFMLGRRRH